MSKRRKRNNFLNESDNQDRWLVSYADFVTLLFAFFVLMYSVSSVDNIEYENLSEVLEEAFTHDKPEQPEELEKLKPDLETEAVIESSETVPTTIEPIILDNPVVAEKSDLSEEILKEKRLLQLISENFEDVLQPYIENNLIKVIRNDFWIELEMNSELLFLSGEAEISPKATPVLKKVADIVRRMPNIINVEGHTDYLPIETMEYSSNWGLSSARASSVVKEFVNFGILPKRLAAIGYGEHHPVADNATEEGRNQNRRVVLVLMSQAFARYGMSDEDRAKILNFNRSESDNVGTESQAGKI
jgi:chemotaxis protein MotB